MTERRPLRIFQVITSRSTSGYPEGRTWWTNLHEPLVDLGCDVVIHPAEAGQHAFETSDASLRDRFSEEVLHHFVREHAKRPFDLFFAYFIDGMVDLEVVDEIRATGVPTCNFSCNNEHQFHLVEQVSPHFDFSLHSEKSAAEKFERIGAKPLWFPMAANPTYYHPYDVPQTIEVSFVGQCYALRPRHVLRLLTEGVDVQVFGPGWLLDPPRPVVGRPARAFRRARALSRLALQRNHSKRHALSAAMADKDLRARLAHEYGGHLHRPVGDEEMVKLYSRSALSLGFLEVFDEHDPSASVLQHIHLREFEAPMSGAAYITNYSDELAEFYEPDREVIMWRNEHELVEKVRFYLRHPEETQRVREAGRRRALECHTYQRRFSDLFRTLGLSGE